MDEDVNKAIDGWASVKYRTLAVNGKGTSWLEDPDAGGGPSVFQSSLRLRDQSQSDDNSERASVGSNFPVERSWFDDNSVITNGNVGLRFHCAVDHKII